MAKVEVYRCDECGAEKKETNHWFVVTVGQAFTSHSWAAIAKVGTLSAFTHVCGEACAQKIYQRWLSGGRN